MGNVEHQIEKILFLVTQIKNEIPRSKFFELGDDQKKLEKIDKQLKRVYESLESLRDDYTPRPLSESNPYLQAVMFVEETQVFIRHVRQSRKGSTDNTRNFLAFIKKLEESIRILVPSSNRNFASSVVATKENPKTLNRMNKLYLPGETNAMKIDVPKITNVSKRKSSKLANTALKVISFPKPLGRFIFDTIKYEKAVDSSSIIMGWIVIIIAVLILQGVIPIETIFNTLTEK